MLQLLRLLRRQQSYGVVERHGFDVERAQDGLLVDEVAVVASRVSCREDDAHVAHVYVHRPQIRSVQRRTLE